LQPVTQAFELGTRPAEESLRRETVQPGFTMALFSLFAAFALTLSARGAAVGVISIGNWESLGIIGNSELAIGHWSQI
jgi:hypothetical protein